ncbi:hypothetical protein E2C01_080343 [Portunus trituberculatus]|uniref:Uncharacterized protein n=1 Tax=Portunus trituberculatus TaxID=210409 RepID=A0A5B7IP22_PORTR|nr:hypothetical protein [Portunus trituberculatus]
MTLFPTLTPQQGTTAHTGSLLPLHNDTVPYRHHSKAPQHTLASPQLDHSLPCTSSNPATTAHTGLSPPLKTSTISDKEVYLIIR